MLSLLFDLLAMPLMPKRQRNIIRSWSKTKCDKCGKQGVIGKQCFGSGLFGHTKCSDYDKSHSHHRCESCNTNWITRTQ